jgi:hypothetical protein
MVYSNDLRTARKIVFAADAAQNRSSVVLGSSTLYAATTATSSQHQPSLHRQNGIGKSHGRASRPKPTPIFQNSTQSRSKTNWRCFWVGMSMLPTIGTDVFYIDVDVKNIDVDAWRRTADTLG